MIEPLQLFFQFFCQQLYIKLEYIYILQDHEHGILVGHTTDNIPRYHLYKYMCMNLICIYI